ncbi:MAG TPA: 3-hydroxybutyryl-CoA dehydrogenase [Candidatus Xenobia bacterium]
MKIKTVSVVGAGTMGNGIAQVFAQHGFNVTLIDVSDAVLQQAVNRIEGSLSKLQQKGKLSAEQVAGARERLGTGTSLSAAATSELVVEAVSENLALKSKIFRELDGLLDPDAIIASNTSSISITTLGAVTHRPAQVAGMHFMNPVPLMPLVELIRGAATDQEVIDTIHDLCLRLGKTPVLAQDYPGFISNRILMPMINEAVFALMEGVGTPEAIDTVMKLGMNHPMGPLELADFIGLDVCLAIMEVLHQGLGDDKYRPCPLLRRTVAAGHLGRKSGRGFYSYAQEAAIAR